MSFCSFKEADGSFCNVKCHIKLTHLLQYPDVLCVPNDSRHCGNCFHSVFSHHDDAIESAAKKFRTTTAVAAGLMVGNDNNPTTELIGRTACIDKVNTFLQSEHSGVFLIIAPSGAGKTSILHNIYTAKLSEDRNIFYVNFLIDDNPYDRLSWLFDKHIKCLQPEFDSADEIILLLDDSHNCYPHQPNDPSSNTKLGFWEFLLKSFFNCKKFKVIIAATYLIADGGSPPGLSCLDSDFLLSRQDLLLPDQASGLFDENMKTRYPNLVNMIIEDCNGLVGALVIAIDIIHKQLKNCVDSLYPTELELIQPYLSELKPFETCFGNIQQFAPADTGCRDKIRNCIIHLSPIDAGTQKQLFKAGFITNEEVQPVQFTSLLAKRFLYNVLLFPMTFRATISIPTSSLFELIVLVIQSMSSKVLSQSVADTNNGFPREIVFQHLFMDGLWKYTSSATFVCPSSSHIFAHSDTSSTSLEGETSATASSLSRIPGDIDFFVNGQLRWGIELLVQGGGISEHLLCFEPKEKYAALHCNDYFVVDLRQTDDGAPTKITVHDKRVTVFFKKGDFQNCIIVYGSSKQEMFITLAD